MPIRSPTRAVDRRAEGTYEYGGDAVTIPLQESWHLRGGNRIVWPRRGIQDLELMEPAGTM